MLRPTPQTVVIGPPPEDALLAAELSAVRQQLRDVEEQVRAIAPRLATITTVAPAFTRAGDLIRLLWRERRLRNAYFPGELFAEAGWSVLLALGEVELDGKQMSVSSATYAAEPAPPTTALRHIRCLVANGLVQRERDPQDKRRAFLRLTVAGRRTLTEYVIAVAHGRGIERLG